MSGKKRVLLVEDDEIIAFLHKHFLEKCGFETIETVDNGIEAIEDVRAMLPDTVLMSEESNCVINRDIFPEGSKLQQTRT